MYFCADLESDSKSAYFYTTRMITRKIEQTISIATAPNMRWICFAKEVFNTRLTK